MPCDYLILSKGDEAMFHQNDINAIELMIICMMVLSAIYLMTLKNKTHFIYSLAESRTELTLIAKQIYS